MNELIIVSTETQGSPNWTIEIFPCRDIPVTEHWGLSSLWIYRSIKTWFVRSFRNGSVRKFVYTFRRLSHAPKEVAVELSDRKLFTCSLLYHFIFLWPQHLSFLVSYFNIYMCCHLHGFILVVVGASATWSRRKEEGYEIWMGLGLGTDPFEESSLLFKRMQQSPAWFKGYDCQKCTRTKLWSYSSRGPDESHSFFFFQRVILERGV